MRGAVPGLTTPQPLADGLPAAFFGNDFTHGLVSAFDAVLAPVFAVLDDFDAYLDPRYAPDDFVRWLAGWFGALPDERWPVERLRGHLPDLVEALRWQGTVRGVTAAVRAYTGVEPEVTDSGGVTGSTRPRSALPERAGGGGVPWLRVVVDLKDADGAGGPIDPDVLDRLVASVKPAHVRHEILLSGGAGAQGR